MTNQQEEIKAFSIRIASNLAIDIGKIAIEEDRSINKIITLAIKEYINNHFNKSNRTTAINQ